MRSSRRVLIAASAVLLPAAVAGLGDLAVEELAERRAASSIAQELDADAEVELHGWPAGLRLLGGRVPRVDVTATGVPLEEVTTDVDHLAVRLDEVRTGWDELRGAGGALPDAARGTFEARISADTTFALASVPRSILGVAFEDGRVELDVVGQQVPADVQAEDGQLVIVPDVPLGRLVSRGARVDISDQPGSPRIEEAEVDGAVLVARGRLEDLG